MPQDAQQAGGRRQSELERLVFHEVNSDRWNDLERLFQSPGGPKHCWCMVWRSMPRGESRSNNQAKKAALERRVREGVPVGILGYLDGEPVAWCSIAPRATYRDLGGKSDPTDESGNVCAGLFLCAASAARPRGRHAHYQSCP
jgi:hypothetical protein